MRSQLKRMWPFVFFFVVAGILCNIYFHGLKDGEFIFSGDQLLRFSYQESFDNSFFIRKMDHFGVFNSWQQIVQLWDEAYYLLAYSLGMPTLLIEQVSFFLTLVLSFTLSFIGFRKISSLFQSTENKLILVVITLWYCLNPYTLVLWHGGVYNLGLAMTYALAPLIFYFFHLAVFGEPTRRNRIICALLLLFASFTFWLFAALVFLLVCYTLLYLFLRRGVISSFLKHAGLLLGIYLPLVSFILFALFHEHSNNTGDVNSEFVPSFGSQQGGMWYQFLMLFSWGIYTVWTPRALYPFGDYFLSLQYTAVTLGIYALIVIGTLLFFKDTYDSNQSPLRNTTCFLKEGKHLFLIIFFLLLGISVFFAKGAQDPLGEIFVFLYNHFPFFSVFRSADHRFGFVVVFAVAVLLLYVSRRLQPYVFVSLLMGLMLLQSYPMFTGIAVRGQNIEGQYYDRILRISPEYKQVADVLNRQAGQSGYVLALPSAEYGHYVLNAAQTEHHVGQDLLPKLIRQPFVYLSSSSGMSRSAAETLTRVLEKKDYEKLSRFPIAYVILRQDIPCTDCLNIAKNNADKAFTRLLQNELFSVYAVNSPAPLIQAENAFFKMINPTKFKVELDHVSQHETLNLLLSFSPGWKVYLEKQGSQIECEAKHVRKYAGGRECVLEQQFFEGNELSYLFKKSLSNDAHTEVNGYANSWELDTDFIQKEFSQELYAVNDDGTLRLNLTVYYQPQSWYYVAAFLTVVSLILGLVILVMKGRKKKTEIKN